MKPVAHIFVWLLAVVRAHRRWLFVVPLVFLAQLALLAMTTTSTYYCVHYIPCVAPRMRFMMRSLRDVSPEHINYSQHSTLSVERARTAGHVRSDDIRHHVRRSSTKKLAGMSPHASATTPTRPSPAAASPVNASLALSKPASSGLRIAVVNDLPFHFEVLLGCLHVISKVRVSMVQVVLLSCAIHRNMEAGSSTRPPSYCGLGVQHMFPSLESHDMDIQVISADSRHLLQQVSRHRHIRQPYLLQRHCSHPQSTQNNFHHIYCAQRGLPDGTERGLNCPPNSAPGGTGPTRGNQCWRAQHGLDAAHSACQLQPAVQQEHRAQHLCGTGSL
jgi:hypothetical protein